MRVLNTNEMRIVENVAINKLGIPSICLMENAGKEVAMITRKHLDMLKNGKVIIIAGKGNNGGDGYVAARFLFNWGIDVKVFLTANPALITQDARRNLDIILNMGIYVAEISQREHLKFLEKSIKDCDVIIDAIYGIGLSGEVSGISKEIIDMINQSNKFVISIDVPSGLNASTGRVEGCAVKADKTVTIQFIKPGLIVYPGVDYAGELVIADAGIPDKALEDIKCDYNLIVDKDVRLKKRDSNTHKGDYGKVLIIAGSRNMSGAAVMCAKSAIKTGCGLVKLAVPKAIQPVVQGVLSEVITYGMEDVEGIFSYKALDKLIALSEECDAVAVGPGMTYNSDITELISKLVINIDKPFVLDADALNALQGKLDILKGKNVILTPHYGEMARIAQLKIDEIKNDIFGCVKNFCTKYCVTLVLKGARSVIGSKDGCIYINKTGNPGMATAGSGDALTGMIVSFLAQGFLSLESAIYGVFYHGKAGDIAKEKYGEYGMTATNIIEYVPEALKSGS